MSNNGLKPCGYCGGESIFTLSFGVLGPRLNVRCKKCGAKMGPYVFHKENINFRVHRKGEERTCRYAIEKAREDWNRKGTWRSGAKYR